MLTSYVHVQFMLYFHRVLPQQKIDRKWRFPKNPLNITQSVIPCSKLTIETLPGK